MRSDGRTDMTKLIVAFRNFGNAPKFIAILSRYAINTEGTWWNQCAYNPGTLTSIARYIACMPEVNVVVSLDFWYDRKRNCLVQLFSIYCSLPISLKIFFAFFFFFFVEQATVCMKRRLFTLYQTSSVNSKPVMFMPSTQSLWTQT